MITSEIHKIRSKYPARFRFANVLPKDRLPSKIKFRNFGNSGFEYIFSNARNLGAVPDNPSFASTRGNDALNRIKALGIDIYRSKAKDYDIGFSNWIKKIGPGYKWLGIIKIKKLMDNLEKQGVPGWLKLRAWEERNAENAVRTIIGRLGSHEKVLEVYDEEGFLSEAKRVDSLLKADYLVFASEILFGRESSDVDESIAPADSGPEKSYIERSKITNESQKINFLVYGIKTLSLPDDIDSQYYLLTSAIKRLILLKDLDHEEMSELYGSLFMSAISKLYAEDPYKQELLISLSAQTAE